MTPAFFSSILLRGYQVLRDRSGRSTIALDVDIPASAISRTITEALVEAIRGFVRTRRLVFLGRGTKVRYAGRIEWGRGSRIGQFCKLDGLSSRGVILGAGSRIGDFSHLTCTSHLSRLGQGFTLGPGSGLGDYCHIGASGGVVIGSNVLAGAYVSFHSQDHVFEDSSRLIRDQGVSEKGIRIGDNCWIGAKATFLDGAEVGDGSVVAAGAVVKGKFPAGSVIAGVPARLVRTRE